MFPNHQRAIDKLFPLFTDDPAVEALLLGGSIAHGYASESSDVDIMIVVTEEEHAKRSVECRLQYYSPDLTDYAGGFVDGKYVSRSFLNQVEAKGSEPARFAFADARVLYSRIDGIDQQLDRISRYPVEQKVERIRRFRAQFEAWRWYAGEANKRNDGVLMGISVDNVALFGARMLLAHNERLFPFYKWMLRVLDDAPDKPDNIVPVIRELCASRTYEAVDAYHNLIMGYREWEVDSQPWPNRFMIDTELTWMNDGCSVDDI
jgi:predicted nucleotidyltransferase